MLNLYQDLKVKPMLNLYQDLKVKLMLNLYQDLKVKLMLNLYQDLKVKLIIKNLELSKSDRDICYAKESMAKKVYKTDKQIRWLDADLQQYERKISKRIISNSDSKHAGQLTHEIPSMVALTLVLTDNKDEMLDGPVDLNERVYYLCHQDSFGEMVACFEASNGRAIGNAAACFASLR